MHEVVHVLILLMFVPAVALMVVALVAPLLAETPRDGRRFVSMKVSLALGAVAGAGLAVEWMIHRF